MNESALRIRKTPTSSWQYKLYRNGKLYFLPLSGLVKEPDCVINRSALASRIKRLLDGTSQYTTLLETMTSPVSTSKKRSQFEKSQYELVGPCQMDPLAIRWV